MAQRKLRLFLLFAALLATPLVAYFFFRNHPVSGRVTIRGTFTLDLPPGSWHHIGRGIDSYVGDIRLGGSGITLTYVFGLLGGGGTYLGPFLWKQHEEPGGISMDYFLTNSGATQALIVCFPNQSVDFSSEVENSGDIESVLRVMRTFRPLP